MTTDDEGGRDPLYAVAGLADLALDRAGAALRGLRGLLGRSDLAELARDGQDELTARGRLLVQRHAATPEAHLELLARRAAARTDHARRDDV
ncbi:hypothetical protein [Kitasatospora viridis]|uniref:Polyprenyl synthetase n=1 Tax=Kitasatospora viridis TaxID=281105 RepID=A0A561UC56_9ACTN|nr:hypothetical protein [Kitasatospora viridis]TWF96940.1 hypothetical protein FHX73_11714 [Kitasatospora viridis]